MFKFSIITEEKTSKTGKHKKLSIVFKKDSSNLFTYILKLIKSFL